MVDDHSFTMRTVERIADIGREAWDRCASFEGGAHGTRYNPFVSYDFLHTLEETGCVRPETGWLPQHLLLEGENGPAGVVPAYLKSHSQGEYVFDHGWADAYERAGGHYYPKIQISVPFTPATGPRLLIAPSTDLEGATAKRALARGIQQMTQQFGASSAHLTFLTQDDWWLLGEAGYLQRKDQQFHWQNEEYADFDAFLSALSSRKRKVLKRERREALANTIEIEWVTGSDLGEEHWDDFFAFYLDTGARKWGRPYLTREFFSVIGEKMANQILLIFAIRDGKRIAGALNFIGSDTLYGRHWGCIEHHPFLHFEVCYYQAIDFAISRKLDCVEAGAQGAHKLARGYLPRTTYSAHYIRHEGLREAIDDYLRRERMAVDEEQQFLTEHSPFKSE